MKGSLTIRTYPERTVIVRCDECGCEGRFTRTALAERFGWEKAMPDVLSETTKDCRRGGYGTDPQCRRPVFIDPRTGRPWAR